jgi:hypothetical protein
MQNSSKIDYVKHTTEFLKVQSKGMLYKICHTFHADKSTAKKFNCMRYFARAKLLLPANTRFWGVSESKAERQC